MAEMKERTFIAIKPDGVQRGIIGEVIKRFETKGFKLVGMKMLHASDDLLMKHYADLKERPFFPTLIKYMSSGPVIAMVWEGKGAVKTGRVMLGETSDLFASYFLFFVHGLERRRTEVLKVSIITSPSALLSSYCTWIWSLMSRSGMNSFLSSIPFLETFHRSLKCTVNDCNYP
uniref:Nucleoside diphosphate kinase B n=1 Tax=Anoplopoma fimbria TaxID=229290 RepID=C3KHZ0_ANOFI|nr:Nucleoside diphosphate kinase [Anoplopoma fimbria]